MMKNFFLLITPPPTNQSRRQQKQVLEVVRAAHEGPINVRPTLHNYNDTSVAFECHPKLFNTYLVGDERLRWFVYTV